MKLTNLQFANVLRAIAQVYEDNPEIPQIYDLTHGTTGFIFCHSKEMFAATVKAFGPGRKDTDEDGLVFYPALAEGTPLKVYAFKNECCQRIEVGTKVIPASEATIIPAAPERIEPVYKYACAPFLAAPAPETVEA